MKKFALCLIGFATIMVSCNKEKTPPPAKVAGLVAFNLAPDQSQVMITVDGNYFLSTPLSYSKFSGQYNAVNAGDRTVVTFDNASNNNLDQGTFTFVERSYYSLFLLGFNGNYQNLIVEDKLSSLPASNGKSFVRYLYAIPDSLRSRLTIGTGGTNTFDEDGIYSHISDFQQINPGSVDVKLKNVDENIDVEQSLTLDANGIYTIIIHGISKPLNPDQGIKVSMIKNGIAQ